MTEIAGAAVIGGRAYCAHTEINLPPNPPKFRHVYGTAIIGEDTAYRVEVPITLPRNRLPRRQYSNWEM